jgi:hypothetical protein
VDVELEARETAQRLGFQAQREAFAEGGGRPVDVEVRSRHAQRCQKDLISSDFSEPSDGLEPSTPSLPWRLRSLLRDLGNALGRALSLQFGWFLQRKLPFLEEP